MSVRRERPISLDREVLLTVTQAASMLQTQETVVYSLIKAGQVRALKLGNLKIRRQEIDRFLKEGEGYDFSDPQHVRPLETG